MADLVHTLPFNRVSDSGRDALENVILVDAEYNEIVDSYNQAMRSYLETDQLFNQFQWSYFELCRLAPCDRGDFLTDEFQYGKFDPRTVANGAFGNFISAARNAIDKMDAVAGDYFGGRKSKGYLTFKKLPSSWIDRGGLYVLMYELRNPIQHGQTVVSVVPELGRYRLRLDLDQLADLHLFNTSKKLTSFISRALSAIRGIDPEGSPFLCFRYSNMLYHELVIELYSHFLKCVQPHVRMVNSQLRAMLSEHKEFVGQIEHNEFVAYSHGDRIHVVENLEIDGLKSIRTRGKEVDKMLTEARKTVAFEQRHSTVINPVCSVLSNLML